MVGAVSVLVSYVVEWVRALFIGVCLGGVFGFLVQIVEVGSDLFRVWTILVVVLVLVVCGVLIIVVLGCTDLMVWI